MRGLAGRPRYLERPAALELEDRTLYVVSVCRRSSGLEWGGYYRLEKSSGLWRWRRELTAAELELAGLAELAAELEAESTRKHPENPPRG
jgi:hypothetical protein